MELLSFFSIKKMFRSSDLLRNQCKGRNERNVCKGKKNYAKSCTLRVLLWQPIFNGMGKSNSNFISDFFFFGNTFAAGEANFGQAMYRSLERSPQDTRYGFDLYSAQASLICLTARWSLLQRLSAFWIISFEVHKVFWIRFSSWESFIGFYSWCYPISEIIACLSTVGVRISWKSCVGKGAFAEIRSSASYLACVIILYRG